MKPRTILPQVQQLTCFFGGLYLTSRRNRYQAKRVNAAAMAFASSGP